MTEEGPQLANPAFRFGVQLGSKLRAVDDLKRSTTNRAADVRTPVKLPTWGHFSAVIRSFQERGLPGNLAMARADHRDAYKQLPVRDDRKVLAVVALKELKFSALADHGAAWQITPLVNLTAAWQIMCFQHRRRRIMPTLKSRRRGIQMPNRKRSR